MNAMETHADSMSTTEIDPSLSIQCGNTLLDAGVVGVRVAERACDLTISEFRVLQMLFKQPNLLIPKGAFMDGLFSRHAKRPGEGILRVYMHRVRARLRDLDSNLAITTRHGIGWILVAPKG